MKITQIGVATLVPATIAGLAVSVVMPFAQAAQTPQHASARTKAHASGHVTAASTAPRYTPEWVTVQAGDSLSSIAAARHISWQALYATPPNPHALDGSTVLYIGERLRIPADPVLRAAQFQAKYAAELQGDSADQTATEPQQSDAGQASMTAGESAFEQCVAWRESSDTPTDPDGLYGILPSTWASLGYSGTAGEAPVALQQVAFQRLYAEYGVQPWAPSDGC